MTWIFLLSTVLIVEQVQFGQSMFYTAEELSG